MPQSPMRPLADPFQARFPDPDVGPWTLTVGWQKVEGRLAPTELHLDLVDRERPAAITTRTLRTLRLGRLLEEELSARRQRLAGQIQNIAGIDADDPEEAQFWNSVREELEGDHALYAEGLHRNSGGRPKEHGREFYEQVAAVYLHHLDRTQKPTTGVAQKWGVTASTAAGWVHTARHKYGLLPPTRMGRSGGASTP